MYRKDNPHQMKFQNFYLSFGGKLNHAITPISVSCKHINARWTAFLPRITAVLTGHLCGLDQ